MSNLRLNLAAPHSQPALSILMNNLTTRLNLLHTAHINSEKGGIGNFLHLIITNITKQSAELQLPNHTILS